VHPSTIHPDGCPFQIPVKGVKLALQSGFQDYSGYIQLFRRQFGMTPGQYRKKLTEGPERIF